MSIEKAKQYLEEKKKEAKLAQAKKKEIEDQTLLVTAAVLGNRDAAKALLNRLADQIENETADEDERLLIAEVLRKIVAENQAAKYLAAAPPKTRSTRSFLKMQKIFDAVELIQKDNGTPLISHVEQGGAFQQVAENLHMDESTVNRHYYDYKEFLTHVEKARLLYLTDPENIEKFKSTCKTEFVGLISALAEGLTKEEKEVLINQAWPIWVENWINHYFDV